MSSTDKEKGMIKEWVVRSNSRIEGKDRDSFWDKYEIGEDIIEYDFHTVPELKKLFGENLVGCEDVILPLSVASFKKKEDGLIRSESKEDSGKDDFEIPEFIYVF